MIFSEVLFDLQAQHLEQSHYHVTLKEKWIVV